MYAERSARSLPGAVVWTRSGPHTGGEYRVLPDGCTDIIWADGRLLVAGPDSRAFVARDAPDREYAAIRFAPGQGPSVLGVEAHELRNQRVPLDALWPAAEARRLAEQVADAPDRAAAVEALAVRRLRDAAPPPAYVGPVVAALRAGRTVAEVADRTGLGERTLHRRSLAAFGYGPKTLARVLRLNRALDLARGGLPYAEVAAAAGYADQAHLAREVKTLAGVALGELLQDSEA
ncbi:helix-turn-helix domain-containing protein [Streptomyces sp. A7024]|uniref:Helix-turn-helix domain-containing protein n=1 Tax=Streptomyces coryli TaxID=1128680 RepID=A0A6G4TWX0_9ACTN|nr:helix-turn-helix domain-containing protein [Streptomyces coryli]NGN63608.1 helix-turn-helix domain-containing protein [Streptomyces coryli]